MTPQDFITQYESALATQSWEAVDPLIHPDCAVTFSNGSYHQGKAQVQAAFQKNFDLIQDEAYSIAEVNWMVKEEAFAVYTYTYQWSGIIHGEPASGEGRGSSTIVLRDGKWQLVLEHLGPK